MTEIEATLKTLLNNPVIMGLVAISLTMYGPRLSPKLPSPIRRLFDTSIFRFLVILLIIWIGSRDIRLSLIISIVFLVLMSLVNNQTIKEDFDTQLMEYYHNYNLYDSINNENFLSNDTSIESPNNLQPEKEKEEEDISIYDKELFDNYIDGIEPFAVSDKTKSTKDTVSKKKPKNTLTVDEIMQTIKDKAKSKTKTETNTKNKTPSKKTAYKIDINQLDSTDDNPDITNMNDSEAKKSLTKKLSSMGPGATKLLLKVLQ